MASGNEIKRIGIKVDSQLSRSRGLTPLRGSRSTEALGATEDSMRRAEGQAIFFSLCDEAGTSGNRPPWINPPPGCGVD